MVSFAYDYYSILRSDLVHDHIETVVASITAAAVARSISKRTSGDIGMHGQNGFTFFGTATYVCPRILFDPQI